MFEPNYTGSSAPPAMPIRNIFVHITKACNLRCSYCYFAAVKPLPDELTTEELAQLWMDMARIEPQKVILTGGEPLLRADLLETLRALDRADSFHRIRRCINTNGHLLTPRLVRQLVGLVDEIRVSLDGMPERNDSQRAPGNFDAVMRAIAMLQSAGFEPKVLVTITAKSHVGLEEFVAFLVAKGIRRIKLNPVRLIGRAAHQPQLQVSLAEIGKSFQAALSRHLPQQASPLWQYESELPANCGVGQFLNIMPNGDVFPCHTLTTREFLCGNVRSESLLGICGPSSKIARLAQLNFRQMAEGTPALAQLRQSRTCLGPAYEQTKNVVPWRDLLQPFPIVGQPN